MSNLGQAIWAELRKVRRSKMPLLTVLGFALAPLAGGFFMIILKDPALARRMGMISTKAQIIGGAADWPTYLDLLAQAVAIGGILLFSLIASWVFGREYSDHTLKDLLALPTARSSIVLAKFIVVALWALLLALVVYLLGLVVGVAVGLPPAAPGIIQQGTLVLATAALLTIVVVTPIAFFAGIGRGYLAPMGAALLFVVLAQIVAAAGWGEYFPWSIPALSAGMAGPEGAQLGPASYLLVLLTGAIGVFATLVWWEWADHV